jgi:hypothetical protein
LVISNKFSNTNLGIAEIINLAMSRAAHGRGQITLR